MFQKEICALVLLNTELAVLNQLCCTWKLIVNPRSLGIIWRRGSLPPPPTHLGFVRKQDYVLSREPVWFQHPRMCNCQFFILPGGENRHQPGPAFHGPTPIIFLNNSPPQHSPALEGQPSPCKCCSHFPACLCPVSWHTTGVPGVCHPLGMLH